MELAVEDARRDLRVGPDRLDAAGLEHAVRLRRERPADAEHDQPGGQDVPTGPVDEGAETRERVGLGALSSAVRPPHASTSPAFASAAVPAPFSRNQRMTLSVYACRKSSCIDHCGAPW